MWVKRIMKSVLGEEAIIKLKDIRDKLSGKVKNEDKKKAAFYSNFVSKGDLYFDVGANVGNRIRPLLNIGAKVVAVEPQESCQKHLKIKFGDKINLVTQGLCEEECVREFHINTVSTTISSFSDEWINAVKDGRFKGNKWDKTVEVQMTTLENLIVRFGTPAFIKIDVEGYELEVLKGLRTAIKMISIEYTVPEQVQQLKDCLLRIKENDQTILCNYSIGESMEWGSNKWMPVDEFVDYIHTSKFINTGFGDVYIKGRN